MSAVALSAANQRDLGRVAADIAVSVARQAADDVDRDALIKTGAGIKGGSAGRGLEGYIVRLNQIRDQRNASAPEP